MSDPMAEIRASFFVECEELLESLQDGLQLMDDGEDDAETINVVFRAVHSIKGGAGAFGLDALVKFAHRFETAMDEVRAGRFVPDAAARKIFFQCADIVADLVRAARDDDPIPEEITNPVLEALEALVGMEEEVEEELDFQPMTLSIGDDGAMGGFTLPDLGDLPPLDSLPSAGPDDDDQMPDAAPSEHVDLAHELADDLEAAREMAQSGDRVFEIRFTPEDSLYASGNEPLYLMRALRDIGGLKVRCDTTRLPGLDGFNSDTAYLGWVMTLVTEQHVDNVREVFEFVDGLCELSITEIPGTPPKGDPVAKPLKTESAMGSPAKPSAAPGAAPLALLPQTPSNTAPHPVEVIKPAADVVQVVTVPDPNAPPKAKRDDDEGGASAPRPTVRVDLERIDRLVNLVGELVINQAMLSQSVAEAGLPPNSPVSTGLEEFLQLTRDIQESVMMIRAQPIKSLFQRMGRIVRESSASVNKDVRLVTEGENTEVDKTVIERLADPLTHMIRNAVDHGLESTEKRLAAGKPAEGRVSLTANHRSGRILIEVSDDGGGINRPRVREIAINKGLIAADAQLTDGDIDNLLFLPGFSTASTVSNLSGRGVGMDVVRSSIQQLGGRISITSVEGKGTTFSISLPLTLAVLDGMVIRVAGETLVVPLAAILETLSLTDEDLRVLGPETHVVQIRGGFVPLLDLGAELGYRTPKDSYVGGIVLLIGQEDGNRAALVVDAIEDQRQVVIKGLEGSYGRVPGIAAATILGDGQIALILDPVDLVGQASGRTRKRPAQLSLAG